MKMDSILHPCVMVSAFEGRLNVITERRISRSTMLVIMFKFLPSGITKDTSMMLLARYLSPHNCLKGQVLQLRVQYQCSQAITIKSLKDSWLLKPQCHYAMIYWSSGVLPTPTIISRHARCLMVLWTRSAIVKFLQQSLIKFYWSRILLTHLWSCFLIHCWHGLANCQV